MGAVSGSIPNLIGGTSQQPAEIRAINTFQSLLNTTSSAATGLFTRPNCDYVGRVSSRPSGQNTVAKHTINKSAGKYEIVIHGGTVFVMDLSTGLLETVQVEGGAGSYLDVSDAANHLGFVTVADTTFIYNKTKVVTKTAVAESGVSGFTDVNGQVRLNPNQHGTFWVMQRAGYPSNYSIYVNNALKANVATDSLKPSEIANNLTVSLASAGYSAALASQTVGSVQFDAETDYLVSSDDFANQAIRAYNDKIEEFTDLPNFDRQGRLVLVEQSSSASQDDYWVWYTAGEWKETVGWNAAETLDVETMPVVLLDNGNGTWTLKYHGWSGRLTGDADSNPTPSFVGHTINWMGLVKGRMAVLADENFITSQVADFENFYRSTCTQLLDTDPIDIADPKSRGAKLNSLVWFNDALLAWSDGDQFRIGGDSEGLLSPNTVEIRKVNSYSNAVNTIPIEVGPNIIFVDDFSNSEYAQLLEYQVERMYGKQVALPITDQVPEYIPSGVYQLTHSTSNKTLVVLTSGNRKSAWIYDYYYNDQGKVQSSWQEWSFPGDVYGAEFIQDELLVTVAYGDYLEVVKMRFNEGIDARVDDENILLDFKISDADVSVTYANGTSELTLPYEVISDEDLGSVVLVTSLTDTVALHAGVIYRPSSRTGATLSFSGVDLTGEKFYLGFSYKMEAHLNPIYMRDQNLVAIHDGRLQLRRVSVLFSNSGPFTAYTQPPSRLVSKKEFTGFTVGSGTDTLNQFSLNSGEFAIPAYGKADEMVIWIEAQTPWRCRFSSMEWDGSHRAKRRRTT